MKRLRELTVEEVTPVFTFRRLKLFNGGRVERWNGCEGERLSG